MSTVFFTDGALGHLVCSAEGDPRNFVVSVEARRALQRLKAADIKIGLITNLGARQLNSFDLVLERSEALSFIEPELVIHGEGFTHQVFEAAAQAAGEASVLVGENSAERVRALDAGFRTAVPHPSLVPEILEGGELVYGKILKRGHKSDGDRLRRAFKLPVMPLHLTGRRLDTAYVVTSARAAGMLQDAGLNLTVFDKRHDPRTADLYVARDDRTPPEGIDATDYAIKFLSADSKDDFVVGPTDGGLILALPPHVLIDEVHFPDAFHGHNVRLFPDETLANLFVADFPSKSAARFDVAATLSDGEVNTLREVITENTLRQLHAPYVGDGSLEGGAPVSSRHISHPDNQRVTDALCRQLKQIGGGLLDVKRCLFNDGDLKLANVVAELPGSQPGEIVIVSAHLDSTAMIDGVTNPAPGADDDASGIAAVLAAATAAIRISASGQLKRTLRFILFNAEEEKLYGSRVYAKAQQEAAASILAVFQMDMIGFSGGFAQTEFEVHVGCVNNPDAQSRSLELARLIRDVTGTVSGLNRPQVYTENDPFDDRSDHTPFQVKGFAACLVCEDANKGPLLTSPAPRPNPNYHKTSDRKIDYAYAAEIARVVAAAAILKAKG